MFFYRWIQKELFFFASLAFVFIATASVSSFLKHHLHQNTPMETAARVVWPDNQPAIYPETPPASFFEAQKAPQVATRDLPPDPLEKVGNPEAIKQPFTPSKSFAKAPRRNVKPVYTQRNVMASVKTAPRSYRLSHYKATQAKKAPRPRAQTTQAPSVDTEALRAYEVHMKWVRKTLAEYQSKQPSP